MMVFHHEHSPAGIPRNSVLARGTNPQNLDYRRIFFSIFSKCLLIQSQISELSIVRWNGGSVPQPRCS
ncbi:MAG: hypothetical protein RLZZ436_1794 [Planctomycetota bacterium]|jgi:hypothetical protein